MAWHLCYTTRYVYVACAVYGCSGRVVVNSVLTDIAIRTFDFTFLSRACASYSSARSSTRHICVFGAGRNSLCAICHALNETTINGRSAIWLWNSSAWIVLSFRKQGNYNEKKKCECAQCAVRARQKQRQRQANNAYCVRQRLATALGAVLEHAPTAKVRQCATEHATKYAMMQCASRISHCELSLRRFEHKTQNLC